VCIASAIVAPAFATCPSSKAVAFIISFHPPRHRELPEGRYLLGLRTLLMPGHRMRRLPPALATARSLEVRVWLVGTLLGSVDDV